jgi:hypothetical protein
MNKGILVLPFCKGLAATHRRSNSGSLAKFNRHAAGLVAGQKSDLDQSADLLTADNLVWIGSQYLPRRTPVILS